MGGAEALDEEGGGGVGRAGKEGMMGGKEDLMTGNGPPRVTIPGNV